MIYGGKLLMITASGVRDVESYFNVYCKSYMYITYVVFASSLRYILFRLKI